MKKIVTAFLLSLVCTAALGHGTQGLITHDHSAANKGGTSVAAAAGASVVLLSSKTFTATVSFTTSDFSWTAYDEYIFQFVNVEIADNNVCPQIQISQNAGSSWEAGTGYSSTIVGNNSAGTSLTTNLPNVDRLWLTGNTANSGQSNGSGNYFAGQLTIVKPSSGVRKALYGQFAYQTSGGSADALIMFAGAFHANGSAINGLRFGYGAIGGGTFGQYNPTAGTIRVYGVKNS